MVSEPAGPSGGGGAGGGPPRGQDGDGERPPYTAGGDGPGRERGEGRGERGEGRGGHGEVRMEHGEGGTQKQGSDEEMRSMCGKIRRAKWRGKSWWCFADMVFTQTMRQHSAALVTIQTIQW